MDLPVSLMNDGGNCMEKENFKNFKFFGWQIRKKFPIESEGRK